jgi:ElaB/YqjD/DUF883 family membrane-anchored ribosome-binding protein
MATAAAENDSRLQAQARAEMQKLLKAGKASMRRLQKEITSPANKARAEAQIKRAKAALLHLKGEFIRKEKQAMTYARNNPEKALAIAAATGAAAGVLLALLRRKKAA